MSFYRKHSQFSYTPSPAPPTPLGMNCAHKLQGNQLRGLLQRSLDSYVSFFKKHAPVEQIDPQQDRLMWNVAPTFVLDLVDIGGECAPGLRDESQSGFGRDGSKSGFGRDESKSGFGRYESKSGFGRCE